MIILDEPTSELDPIGTEEVFTAVRVLKEGGKTIIMVEHKMEELAQYADRIVVMNEGRIVTQGSSRQVLSQVELLEDLGISPPDVTYVAYLLKKEGFKIKEFPTTLGEGEKMFRKILRRASK